MSTATAVKIATGETESPASDEGPAVADERPEAGQRAWRGLLRAHACLAKRLDAALDQAHGLPLSSYEVLDHLEDTSGGRMRMCDLAEQAQLSRSGLTRLVDRLEREQLIERCSCEQDARGSFACLTAGGRERLEEARVTHMAVVREQFFSRFSEAELGLLADMCQRIAPCAGADTSGC
ncbi:MAG TPA: MarR family transcriptional regulator [Solirubrobacteraceae bacterium]|jgi:DNA-binding MarR family transcriptional regulator|nr:MarR family transcriptional regulator [Solirubrobacteraceae bacterium]